MQDLKVGIQIAELKYAIKNKTYVTARSLQATGDLNYEAAAHLQASGDDEDDYELKRAINNTIDEVKVELGEYLSAETTNTDNLIDSAVENNGEVAITFKLPENFNSAAADALGSGIHDFIVGRSIYAWYRLTFPKLAEECNADAVAALDRAKKSLYKRSRPQRPDFTDGTEG